MVLLDPVDTEVAVDNVLRLERLLEELDLLDSELALLRDELELDLLLLDFVDALLWLLSVLLLSVLSELALLTLEADFELLVLVDELLLSVERLDSELWVELLLVDSLMVWVLLLEPELLAVL